MPENVDFEKIGKGGGVFAPSLIHKNNLIFGNADGYIFCLNKNTGKEQWKFLTGDRILSNPIIFNNHIFIGSTDNYLYKLNLNGELKWKFKAGGSVIGIAKHKNGIVFGSCDSYLYGLDEKGNLKWKFKTGDKIFSQPTIYENKIYFGSSDSYFYCLDENGNLKWKFKTGGEISAIHGVEVSNNKIYFGSADYYIYCLNLNGNLEWKFRTGDIRTNKPVVWKNNLYANGRDGIFYCLNKNTGKEKWKFRFYTGCYSSPVIYNNVIYFGSTYPKNLLFAFTLNGKKLWSFKAVKSIGPPTVDKNKIYFCCLDGHIYCISTKGRKLWNVLKGSGEIPDVTNIAPPPRVNSALWDRIERENNQTEESPIQLSYERSNLQQQEQDIGSSYGGSEVSGVYKGATEGVEQYAKSTEKNREREQRKRKEFFLRRERRM